MAFQVEQISPIQRKLNFTVPASEVSSELDRAFRDVARRVRLRGFRPGKAPRSVIEARFGRSIKQEVAANLINTSFREAASELEFFGQPNVEKGDLERGNDFSFSITVEVKPELELAPYKGVKVDFPVRTVAEAVVEANISSRLESQKSLSEVDRKEVEAGDYVLAEIKVTEGKESVHEHPGTMINTGAEPYYKGLESHLVGLKKGGKGKKLKGVEFAADAQLDELAGKTLDVHVKITSIQAYVTPELSDELAGELGYEGGAEGMRAAIRMQLQGRLDEGAKNQARANLLQALIDANSFEAPRGLIDQQLKALLEEIRIQRAYRGENPKNIQFSDAEIADYRGRATFAAKSSLILDHVSKAEGVEVTDEDLEAKYQEIADARGQRKEAIKGYFEKENAVEDLRARLLEEKTLDWLLEAADLNEIDADANDSVEAAAPAAKAATEEAAPATEEPAADDAPDYASMSAKDLKALAKERGLKGYSKLKKDELVALLQG